MEIIIPVKLVGYTVILIKKTYPQAPVNIPLDPLHPLYIPVTSPIHHHEIPISSPLHSGLSIVHHNPFFISSRQLHDHPAIDPMIMGTKSITWMIPIIPSYPSSIYKRISISSYKKWTWEDLPKLLLICMCIYIYRETYIYILYIYIFIHSYILYVYIYIYVSHVHILHH